MQRKFGNSTRKQRFALFTAVLLCLNMVTTIAGAVTYPYTTTTNDKVNMRRSPNGASIVLERIEQGAAVSVIGESGSYYKVTYNDRTGYIIKEFLGDKAATPAPGTVKTSASTTSSSGFPYQTTTRDKVNLRKSPSANAVVLERLDAGAELTVEGESGDYVKVLYNGVSGYVVAAYVYVKAVATQTPTAVNDINTSYASLSRGNSGKAVKALQQALIELQYLSGDADGNFGSMTEDAVNACQKKNGLKETGTADAALQTLLYEQKTKNADGKTVKVMTLSPLDGVTMREGNTGDPVVLLQERLKTLGYYSGSINGIYTKDTMAAVKAFQSMNNLTSDGLAGSTTQSTLFSSNALPKNAILTPTPAANATATPPGTTVRQGDQGDAAKAVQKRLKELGYLKGTADGKFGTASVDALTAFQKRHGLTQDGVAGKTTQDLLFSSLALPAAGEVTPVPTSTPLTPDNAIVIQIGTRGTEVLNLQKRLTELGYYTAKMDSDYKAADRDAVRSFQSRNGLKADGVAGYETQKVLYSTSAVPSASVTPTPTPAPTPTPDLDTLRQGDSNNQVKAMQQRLIQLGYLSGTADGNFGSGTLNAVIAFQKRNDLTPDGVAGFTTLNKLYSTTASPMPTTTPAPTSVILRQGDSNDAVRVMQQTLIQLGYLNGSADGVFGSNTLLALKAFQSINGLPTDGVAGQKTLNLLTSATAKPAPTVPGSTATPKPTAPPTDAVPKASQVRYANWYTEIRSRARQYPYATVYDYSTGLSWKVHMFSIGAHADSEPLTAEDTATMVKAFGGKYTWTPKSVWVIFSDGRVYMASTHDNPHEVQHITNNNFPGHLCIHFPRTQAEVTAIGSYATSHQAAIDAGWKVTQAMIK